MQLQGFKLQIKNLLGSDENMGCGQMRNKAMTGLVSGIKSGQYFFKSRSLRTSWIHKLWSHEEIRKIQEFSHNSHAQRRLEKMISNVPSSTEHRLFRDSCVRSARGQCMMNCNSEVQTVSTVRLKKGVTALGWNVLGRPLKKFWASELQQKPNSIRRVTGKSLLIIQIQAKLRRIRNIKYCRERRKEKDNISNLVSETHKKY